MLSHRTLFVVDFLDKVHNIERLLVPSTKWHHEGIAKCSRNVQMYPWKVCFVVNVINQIIMLHPSQFVTLSTHLSSYPVLCSINTRGLFTSISYRNLGCISLKENLSVLIQPTKRWVKQWYNSFEWSIIYADLNILNNISPEMVRHVAPIRAIL